jgi:hypothetical protein
MSDFILGLDLGQSSDPTALAILKQSIFPGGDGSPAKNHRGDPLLNYDCVLLERFPLGTSYPAIVGRVSELIRNPVLQPRPRLVIDATGAGRPVVDLFADERMPAELHPLTITAGMETREGRWNSSVARAYWVPKQELVSTVQALLQSRRLKIVPTLGMADVLKRELLNFQVKITQAANETFGAWREGAHDDLVLAVAMAAWVGERRVGHRCAAPRRRTTLPGVRDRTPPGVDQWAMRSIQQKLRYLR